MFINFFRKLNFGKNIFVLSFIPLFLWYLIFGNIIISEPYIWDDLHLIRNYTNKQLLEVWYQNWDHDKIETPAYRPIAVWYYHLIYLIFGENTHALRVFILLLLYILVVLVNKTFLVLNFNKSEIIIFSFLIVFSKIFATLASWFTISTLIICYIFVFLSINFFISFQENKKKKFYFLSILFGFIAIFIREELYILPILIFLISFIKNKINQRNLVEIIIKIIPFFFLVLIHYMLRKKFVENVDFFFLKNFQIYYGEKTIGFGGIVKVLKSSFFPMGYPSFKIDDYYQFIFALTWFFLISTIIIGILIKTKDYSLVKKSVIIFLAAIFSSIPHIAVARSFGIMLPTIFITIIISSFLARLFRMENSLAFNKYSISKILAIATISISVFGGIHRSNLHLDAMNKFSISIVHYDTQFIYFYENLSIPKERKKIKELHLNSLNIIKYEKDLNKILASSPLIKTTKYHPLSF